MVWEGVWALAKVLAVFGCMLAGMRARLGIGLSILAGGLLLAFFFGLGPGRWLTASVAAALSWQCVSLGIIVTLILMLSHVLERTGQSLALMDALTDFLPSRRLKLIFFPILIGLLPMPGGAAFSAPMVRQAGEPLGIPGEEMVLVNYWFRHVWEMCWPLYPGLIMTAALLDRPLPVILAHTAPASAAFFALGWWFILRPMGARLRSLDALDARDAREGGDEGRGGGAGALVRPRRDVRAALRLGLPLLLAIAGSFGLEPVFAAWWPGQASEAAIMAALGAAIACVFVQNRAGLAFLGKSLMQAELRQTLLMVAAVFAFNAVMEEASVVRELIKLGGGAALVTAAVFVPMLVGMVAGLTMAFVGAAFPLMLGLLEQLGLTPQAPAWAMLALVAGFSGVMASPLHICYVMTCQYFHVELTRTWRTAAVMSLCFLGFGAAWFFTLTAL